MDDVIVFAKDLEEHQKQVIRLFKRLEQVNLSIQPDKCVFLSKKVEYLGHVITPDGVFDNPGKVSAVLNLPTPKNQTNIRQFL